MGRLTHVLYCHCSYSKAVPSRVKCEVLDRLAAAGVPFEAVSDICAMAARREPALKRIAEAGEVRIAACFPRAVKWLFHAAGTPLADERVKVFNMREGSAQEIVTGLLSGLPTSNGADGAVAEGDRIRDEVGAVKPGAWVPWFPVIDYDRCTNCKQCLSFCLFGVFGLDADDRVEVRNPDHCKTGCPACSRVCPSVAIVFPKYEKGPINGDVVREEDTQREPVKVDVAALVNQGVHSSLRSRSKQAKERFVCGETAPFKMPANLRDLERMRVELGIPDDVSLISPRACECDREGQLVGDADEPAERGRC
jgi:Pyruvate/2-oxoacid:ferredoxin oxidoreductase delta subunit